MGGAGRLLLLLAIIFLYCPFVAAREIPVPPLLEFDGYAFFTFQSKLELFLQQGLPEELLINESNRATPILVMAAPIIRSVAPDGAQVDTHWGSVYLLVQTPSGQNIWLKGAWLGDSGKPTARESFEKLQGWLRKPGGLGIAEASWGQRDFYGLPSESKVAQKKSRIALRKRFDVRVASSDATVTVAEDFPRPERFKPGKPYPIQYVAYGSQYSYNKDVYFVVSNELGKPELLGLAWVIRPSIDELQAWGSHLQPADFKLFMTLWEETAQDYGFPPPEDYRGNRKTVSETGYQTLPISQERAVLLETLFSNERCKDVPIKEVIIRSQPEYDAFRERLAQCQRADPSERRVILDYTRNSILANATYGSCAAGFELGLEWDRANKGVVHHVITHEGGICSGPGNESLNLVVTPAIPDDYQVKFVNQTKDEWAVPVDTASCKLCGCKTKEDITKAIGEPRAVKGKIKNKYNQEIEVLEYVAPAKELLGWACIVNSRETTPESLDTTAVFWLQIVDGILLSCKPAGNWEEEAKDIWETAIVSPALSSSPKNVTF